MVVSGTFVLFAIFAAAVAVALAGFLIVNSLFGRRQPPPVDEAEAGPSLVERVEARRPPKDWSGRVDRSFEHMVQGTMLGISAERAMTIILLVGTLLAVVVFFWTELWWAAGLVFLLGILVPLMVFYTMQARRRQAIQEQLPDAVFLMARSLRAGLSLEQTVGVLADYSLPPISALFRRGAEHVAMGMSAPAALGVLADQVRLADFDALASVTALHRQVGGNLPALLDRLAANIRDRNQFRGYFRTVTALGRITSFFVAAAAPLVAIGLAIFHPELFNNFFTSMGGIIALAVAVVLEIIGVIWLVYLLRRLDY